jgi:hypothetical protein
VFLHEERLLFIERLCAQPKWATPLKISTQLRNLPMRQQATAGSADCKLQECNEFAGTSNE